MRDRVLQNLLDDLNKTIKTSDVCFSGGAEGADIAWGNEAVDNGQELVHFVFKNHNSVKKSKIDAFILSQEELEYADDEMKRVNLLSLSRTFPSYSDYTTNLIRRNYWQIYLTERVYSIANLDKNNPKSVEGGTAWAVEAYKLKSKEKDVEPEIYTFDQNKKSWFKFQLDAMVPWIEITIPPKPHGKWTGIGTRQLSSDGLSAIKSVFAQA